MKFALSVLVGCVLVSCVAASEKSDRQAESYLYDGRDRLGHFKNSPFTDVYKTYVTAFKFDPERPSADYRNYLPSGIQCMTFLAEFVSDDYTINDITEFIPLDACLGYLYESEYHDEDKELNSDLAENLQAYIDDAKLKALYENTAIDSYSNRAKDCIGNLLLNSVKVKHQFTDVDCNHDWLDVFNTFAACHTHIPSGARDTDSYIKLLYELVRLRGTKCFNEEIAILNRAVHNQYSADIVARIKNNVFRNALNNQASNEGMPEPIMKVLAAVENPRTAVNRREVAGILRGIVKDVKAFKERFLNNMATFAQSKIKPSRKSKEMTVDPTGSKRYNDLIDSICNTFRPTTHPDYYDYATPFVRMVRMLEFPEIFGISEDQFVKNVLKRGRQIVPLYLSVSSCNILTYTQGFFVSQTDNKPLQYRVAFKPNLSPMVKWPVAQSF